MAIYSDIGIAREDPDDVTGPIMVWAHVGKGDRQIMLTPAEAREIAAELCEWAAEAEKPPVVDTRPPRQVPAQAHPVFAGILAHIGAKP